MRHPVYFRRLPLSYKKPQQQLTFDALRLPVAGLARVLAVLRLLAFTVEQIQQRRWELFRRVRAGLRTKAELWQSLRSLFKALRLRAMEALYRRMATLYDIQLQ